MTVPKALVITYVLVACAWGCAALGLADRTPAEYAADALAAQAVTHEAAHKACAAYETAVVARRIKADPEVSGRCNALKAAH